MPKKLSHEEYVKRVHDINKNIKVVGTYTKSGIPIRHKCLIKDCGYEWDVMPRDVMRGRGCPVCGGRIIGNPPFYKNSIWSHPEYKNFFEKYLTEEQMKIYMPKSNSKVEVQCPNCCRKKKVYLGHLLTSGLGCICNDNKSYPEKFLFSLLEQANIEFDAQYCPSWSQKKKYDFYIESIRCIVETHGGQHYYGWNHDKNDVSKQQKNDNYKRSLAFENNIKYYIEINCMESNADFIKKNIINSGLLDLLNVNEIDIDWNQCHEFAVNNLVLTVSEMWNAGCSIKKIKEKTKLSDSTIVKYLKIATKIGICNYSQEESKIRSILKKEDKPNATPVYCVELNKVFPTQKQTGHGHVYSCCMGKRKTSGQKHWYYLYDKELDNGTVINGAITLGLITEEDALNQLSTDDDGYSYLEIDSVSCM